VLIPTVRQPLVDNALDTATVGDSPDECTRPPRIRNGPKGL